MKNTTCHRNLVAYNALMNALVGKRQWEKEDVVLSNMKDSSYKNNENAQVHLSYAYVNVNHIVSLKAIIDDIYS